MRKFTKLIGAATLALASAAVGANTDLDIDRQARNLWHDAILAGYQSLATNAADFSRAAQNYCESPDQASRRNAEQAWRRAFLAWQKVRFVDFGPVEKNNLAWQFQFWPDPKNLIAKKARYLVNSEDGVTQELVAQSGVAVQGFPMAEYLLYDKQMNASDKALPATNTCELLVAVADHIAANSDTLSSEWQSLREHFLDTDQYSDATIKAGMAGLEILEERRLAQPMGMRGNGKRSKYDADAWRSGSSLMAVEASLNGLRTYFLPGLSLLLDNSDKPALSQSIKRQFDEVLEHFPEMRAPMEAMLQDDSFAQLQGLYVDVSQLVVLVTDQAAVELGVARGFNSSDGD